MSLWNVFIILAFVGYCTYVFWPDSPQCEHDGQEEPSEPTAHNFPSKETEADYLISEWKNSTDKR